VAARGKTAFIEPGSSWENGYCESFNAKFRYDLLNGEVFYTLREAQILIEKRRRHYNTVRPHSALGYRPPAPETIEPMAPKAHHVLTFNPDHSMGAVPVVRHQFAFLLSRHPSISKVAYAAHQQSLGWHDGSGLLQPQTPMRIDAGRTCPSSREPRAYHPLKSLSAIIRNTNLVFRAMKRRNEA
jgi:hypothetical protein